MAMPRHRYYCRSEFAFVFVFVFLKQKTAYEMRISDWSSDVCSSDLPDEDSEANLSLGRDNHGAALTGIPVAAGTWDTLEFVLEEVVANSHYDSLSAIRLDRQSTRLNSSH